MQASYWNATLATYPIGINPLGGNVGIGTTSPGAKLHVSGGDLIVATSTAGLSTNAINLINSTGDTRGVSQFLGNASVYNIAYNTNTTNGSIAGIKLKQMNLIAFYFF